MVNKFVEALFGRQQEDTSPPDAHGIAAGAVGGRSAGLVVGAASADLTGQEISAIGAALAAMRAEVRRSGAALPTIILSRLGQIDDLLRTVLMTAERQGASTEQRYLLNAMITDYLPSPMRSYLTLPDQDRVDGSRSTTVFANQLEILEETVRDLLNQVRIGAIEELSTHGRFLADKFVGPALRLDSK